MPHQLATVLPDIAVAVARGGGTIELDVGGGLWWDRVTDTLEAVESVDPDVAAAAAQSSVTAIGEALTFWHADMTKHFDRFATALDRIDPTLIADSVAHLAVDDARRAWPERLNGGADERHAVTLVAERAARRSDEIGDLARHLLGRNPG